MQRIVQRDADALSTLYDRHAQTVYNLIVRIVRDHALADDLLQETFWQVWQKARDYTGRGSVAAWLHRIARNRSLDQLRRQKARPQPIETLSQKAEDAVWSQLATDEPDVERIAAQQWERRKLQQAMAQIPDEQRRCLELAYFEGMSQSQIAQYTQSPLGTVKTRLRMGLEKLERIYRGAGYQPRDIE